MIGEREFADFKGKIQRLLDESVGGIYQAQSFSTVGEWVVLAYVADGENQDGDCMMIAAPDKQPLHRTIGLLAWANDIQYHNYEEAD